MYPYIQIRLDGMLHNWNILRSACQEQGISLSLVTKVLGGNHRLVADLVERGQIQTICDSRIQNLAAFEDIAVEKWLIRSPMLSEAALVAQYADASLNTEAAVLEALSREAVRLGKTHKVILMAECGDLREGCYVNELSRLIALCHSLPGLSLYGIGTNLSCLNEVLPSQENMAQFVDMVEQLEQQTGKALPVISGGASSSIELLLAGKLPGRINSLRMGEAVFLGNIPVYDHPFPGARQDNFILKAEVIEAKEKPASPEDPQLRQRAIVALGKQDIYLPGLSCADKRMHIVGGSSDHVILDVTDCCGEYPVGAAVSFQMSYNCLLCAMTSPYIEKKLL